MQDTDYAPTFRQQPRPTDADREAHTRYCEELREAIRLEGIAIRERLAAYWQTNEEPTG